MTIVLEKIDQKNSLGKKLSPKIAMTASFFILVLQKSNNLAMRFDSSHQSPSNAKTPTFALVFLRWSKDPKSQVMSIGYITNE